MEAVNIKEEARRLVEKLPDDATWDDVMHEIYVQPGRELATFEHDQVLYVPGWPRVSHVPGHTPRSSAFVFEQLGVA